MSKKKLIILSGLSNSFEWYDYALFGHFVAILGPKFFPSSDPSVELLHAFLVFAVGYLMRPIGGIFFGVIGDKYGRKSALSTAILCMAFPTAIIGFLPTYDTIGITATTLMIVVRMMQGLSMGGVLTGSISFITEHFTKENRGFAGSVSMASICIGILMGSTVAFVTESLMSHENFIDWGWRIPFILGIFILFTGYYIKRHTEESPQFEEAKLRGDIVRSPLKMVFKNHFYDMIVSILINATGSVIFYLEAIYLVTYLKTTRGFDPLLVTNAINRCYVIMIFTILFVGWLSDRIGRKKILFANLLLIIIFSPILLETLEVGDFSSVCVAMVALAVLSASYIAPEPALQAEFYPTNVRNTALSISYNTATSVFGGTAPFIIESLLQQTHSLTSSVYYIIALSVMSIVGLFYYKDRSNEDYNAHMKNQE